jgi:hypothetical protein
MISLAHKKTRLCALIGALILVSAVSPAAFAAIQARVTAELEGPVLPYHRSATLVVRVDAPKGTTVQWPDLAGKIKDVEITAEAPVIAEKPNERMHAECSYRVDAVKPADYRLPDMDVSVSSATETTSFPLPPLVFHARDLTDEEKAAAATFEESVPISSLEQPKSPKTWWIVGGLLAVLTLAALLWRIFWREKPLPAAPPKPAWEVALARLHELRLRNLPIQGQTERYYVDLSAILRYYVEDRFSLRAPEQTTPEFLDSAAQSGILTEEQQDFLALFLRHSDRVKFARLEPTVAAMEERLVEVEQFVQDTVPRPAGSEPMEGAA